MLANGRWDLTWRLSRDLDGEDMSNIDALHEQSHLQLVIFYSSLHCAHVSWFSFNAGKPNNSDNSNIRTFQGKQ